MRTYLFDFDGTLVDSMPVYAAMMLEILQEYRIPCPPDIIKVITPLGYGGAARLFRQMGLDLEEDRIIALMHQRAAQAYAHRVPAKEHVAQTLHHLKARGDDLYVLTASPHSALDPCLKRLGLFHLFTKVWSCEDFSLTKSDPAIYHMAAARAGRPVEDIWFLDDNINADRAAKEAGMMVCGVYDDSSREFSEQMKALCHAYIRDFSQLLQVHPDQ